MNEQERISLSKFLSLVLRHRPETLGIELDAQGWVEVFELLEACDAHGKTVTRQMLDDIVANSPKQRFAFSPDAKRIRANQGHSVEVELGYEPQTPPDLLFHGTTGRFLDAIKKSGLQKMKRHHVHLSPDARTASNVGGRRGKPVILTIAAKRMVADGHVFCRSNNGVWLVDEVPPVYIEFPD